MKVDTAKVDRVQVQVWVRYCTEVHQQCAWLPSGLLEAGKQLSPGTWWCGFDRYTHPRLRRQNTVTFFGCFCVPTGRSTGGIRSFCGGYHWNPSTPFLASECCEASRRACTARYYVWQWWHQRWRQVQEPTVTRAGPTSLPSCLLWAKPVDDSRRFWKLNLQPAPPSFPKVLEVTQRCTVNPFLHCLASMASVVCNWILTKTMVALLSCEVEMLLS